MCTRRRSIDESLPQYARPLRPRPRRRAVTIPLTRYVRRHGRTAVDFIREKFPDYRVTAIGEQHLSFSGHEGRAENICVRLFLRDCVLRLLRDREETGLKFLVLECDERQIEREAGYYWSDRPLSAYPPGTRNRCASWFARSFPRGRPREQNPNLALMEALEAVARNCDDGDLEVIGIDDFHNREALENASQPDEMEAAQDAREDGLALAFRRRVLSRLDEGRALVFYGEYHVREAGIDPSDRARTSRGSFLQRVRSPGGGPAAGLPSLTPEDVYSVATCYDLTVGPMTIDARPRQAVDVDESLIRIYDLLRAEFTRKPSIGFDIDHAEHNDIALHLGLGNRLGEVFDGYLFFRDMNSWDGQANLPPADRTRRGEVPHFRASRLVPFIAFPGNRVFVYGHVFTAGSPITVTFGTLRSPSVRALNENVLEVEVPSARGVADQTVDVSISRVGSVGQQSFTLSNAFRYHPHSETIF